MPRCFLPCLCLDLHVYVLYTLFVLRSTCLGVFCHVYAQIYMLMCFLPSLCVWIYMFMCLKLCLDAMPSALQLYVSYFYPFLVFGFWVGHRSRSCDLGLHPQTHLTIKGLDQFLYACLCFTYPFPCFFAQIQALCLVLICFPYVGLCLLVFGAYLFVWLYSLLW